MEGIRVRVCTYLWSRSAGNDDGMHTPGTSTETEAPEVAAVGDENDRQKTERSRGCQERISIDSQG
jgi:hypothetical protein